MSSLASYVAGPSRLCRTTMEMAARNAARRKDEQGNVQWRRVKRLTSTREAVHLRPSTAGTYNYEVVAQQGGTVIFSSGPTTLTVNNNPSPSGNSWLNDVESFLGPIVTDPVDILVGWLGF